MVPTLVVRSFNGLPVYLSQRTERSKGSTNLRIILQIHRPASV